MFNKMKKIFNSVKSSSYNLPNHEVNVFSTSSANPPVNNTLELTLRETLIDFKKNITPEKYIELMDKVANPDPINNSWTRYLSAHINDVFKDKNWKHGNDIKNVNNLLNIKYSDIYGYLIILIYLGLEEKINSFLESLLTSYNNNKSFLFADKILNSKTAINMQSLLKIAPERVAPSGLTNLKEEIQALNNINLNKGRAMAIQQIFKFCQYHCKLYKKKFTNVYITLKPGADDYFNKDKSIHKYKYYRQGLMFTLGVKHDRLPYYVTNVSAVQFANLDAVINFFQAIQNDNKNYHNSLIYHLQHFNIIDYGIFNNYS